ncbi:MAG: hypothetical protein P8163_17385 [Candidatus Thiodiazotropha sp.]
MTISRKQQICLDGILTTAAYPTVCVEPFYTVMSISRFMRHLNEPIAAKQLIKWI